jgi:high affinity cAMP-specific and IBMX-insensitive 3',5'-cyclic phosphodiesterase 8
LYTKGKSNPYLVNTQDELALVYNDISVLESYHASLAFRLTRSDPKVNILKNLDRDIYANVRKSVIDMVLATDMAKHFDHVMKFVEVFKKWIPRKDAAQQGLGEGQEHDQPPTTPSPTVSSKNLTTPENIIIIKRLLIKCADVSSAARPLRQCVEWAKRITEEYFAETDEEIARGLPIVLPMFNRKTCSVPKSQTGFLDYFVNNMFSAWHSFVDIPDLMQNLRHSYNYWKALDKKGETHAVYNEAIASDHHGHSHSLHSVK